MDTPEYLDALRAKLSLSSDYQLAKELGLTRQAVSNYRNGTNHFDDDIAMKVAEILEIHPGRVALDMVRQRAKTPQQKALWTGIAEKFSMGFEYLTSCWNPRGDLFSA